MRYSVDHVNVCYCFKILRSFFPNQNMEFWESLQPCSLPQIIYIPTFLNKIIIWLYMTCHCYSDVFLVKDHVTLTLSLLKDHITYIWLMDKQIKIRSTVFNEGKELFLFAYILQNAPRSISLHLSLTEMIIQTNKK